jgi:hypothetical protein
MVHASWPCIFQALQFPEEEDFGQIVDLIAIFSCAPIALV